MKIFKVTIESEDGKAEFYLGDENDISNLLCHEAFFSKNTDAKTLETFSIRERVFEALKLQISNTYITKQPVMIDRLVCNHPLVNQIWEFGGLAALPSNSEMQRFICLQMKDGTKKEFKDSGDGKAVEEAETYLSSLSNT